MVCHWVFETVDWFWTKRDEIKNIVTQLQKIVVKIGILFQSISKKYLHIMAYPRISLTLIDCQRYECSFALKLDQEYSGTWGKSTLLQSQTEAKYTPLPAIHVHPCCWSPTYPYSPCVRVGVPPTPHPWLFQSKQLEKTKKAHSLIQSWTYPQPSLQCCHWLSFDVISFYFLFLYFLCMDRLRKKESLPFPWTLLVKFQNIMVRRRLLLMPVRLKI